MSRLRWSLCGRQGVPRRWVSDEDSGSNLLASESSQVFMHHFSGNFMLSLELRSARNADLAIITAAQPVSLIRLSLAQLNHTFSHFHLPLFLLAFLRYRLFLHHTSHRVSSLGLSGPSALPVCLAMETNQTQRSKNEERRGHLLVRLKGSMWFCSGRSSWKGSY